MKKYHPYIPVIGIILVIINKNHRYSESSMIWGGVIQALALGSLFGYFMSKLLIWIH